MWLARASRPLRRAGARLYGNTMHDHIDHVTGIEKRELLAYLAGDCDPFRIMPVRKGEIHGYGGPIYELSTFDKLVLDAFAVGPGTKERPNLVPSSLSYRLVGCVCNEKVMHVEYMCLHQNEPKRCGCGFWFELCPIAPL